ncbi:hypothetical protein PYH37_003527 [Sinorhizobium numidicum]|uniref:Transposase n=1 Tax=Sinorhizobium numidicum TaxID=680248 RepID=A0ABY8CZ47_9HYPH|nr:hypothetical protein [Sinorhizobium numidicum]WEX78621.1 hypothetical protein PYH37_003527 [Sinorhizobium numidicum]WEX82018.1 hypothetical protein PYH38_004240 [Sinorhizobium numidicum]
MFELISAHKTGKKTKFLPKFAVKSWEDKILGALVAAAGNGLKITRNLENKALALFFFAFRDRLPTNHPTEFANLMTVKRGLMPRLGITPLLPAATAGTR